MGRPTREVWPEAWGFNRPICERVFAGETVFFEDQLYRLARRGPDQPLEDVHITLSYTPVRDERGEVGGVEIVLVDTTAQAARRALQRELDFEKARLEEVFRQAPAFLAVLRGKSHVFELVNDAYYQLVGHREIIGKPVLEALPEVREQGFIPLLDGVLETGVPYIGREVPVMLQRDGGSAPEQRFVDFAYQPLTDADGTRSGVVAHGSDVTAQVLARREVERLLAESEQTREALEDANAPMEGQQVELELVNQQLQENTTELEEQPCFDIMDRVYETGEPFFASERPVPIDRDRDGLPGEHYFDVGYQPLRDAEGRVYAIASRRGWAGT